MRAPYLDDGDVRLYLGDCIEVMAAMPAESVDAVVCDPPYGLEFMGKEWDRPWAVSAEAKTGFTGRGNFTLPSHRDNRNANCRACGGRQRGAKRCKCNTPKWDRAPSSDLVAFAAWCETWAREALRVLKPGGHLLAFGGTRTFHRLTCGIEDAGFEVRDCLSWLYGSGFPKSLDVSKAIDKAAGAERGIEARATVAPFGTTTHCRSCGKSRGSQSGNCRCDTRGTPATDAAREWQGWGTALKPAWEPCVVARKPLAGTVAANVQAHGTGALNIDATRIGVTWDNGVSLCDSCAEDAAATAKRITPETGASTARNNVAPMPNARDRTTRADTCRADTGCSRGPNREGHAEGLLVDSSSSTGASGNSTTDLSPPGGSSTTSTESRPTTGSRTCASCGAQTITASTRSSGRWPSNVALDEAAAAMLDAQTGDLHSQDPATRKSSSPRSGRIGFADAGRTHYGDTGGASRFFYTAKASRADRNTSGANNTHPTVKPTDLMRWLVRLVTPPGGVVLDPFAGSGSTLVAARAEGFRAIGIEREEEYARIIADRLSQLSLFSEAS